MPVGTLPSELPDVVAPGAVAGEDCEDPLPPGTLSSELPGVATSEDGEDPLPGTLPCEIPGAVAGEDGEDSLPPGTLSSELPGVAAGEDGEDPLPGELPGNVAGGSNEDEVPAGSLAGEVVGKSPSVVSGVDGGDTPKDGPAGEEVSEGLAPTTEGTKVPFIVFVSGSGVKILIVGNSLPTGGDSEISPIVDAVDDANSEVTWRLVSVVNVPVPLS